MASRTARRCLFEAYYLLDGQRTRPPSLLDDIVGKLFGHDAVAAMILIADLARALRTAGERIVRPVEERPLVYREDAGRLVPPRFSARGLAVDQVPQVDVFPVAVPSRPVQPVIPEACLLIEMAILFSRWSSRGLAELG